MKSKNESKDAEIVKIPTEWKIMKINDLFSVETGTTPSTKRKEYWKNGTINWITPSDLSKLNGKLQIKTSERKITERASKERNLILMPKDSIILSTRAPVGYVAIVEQATTINQGCKGLIPKNPKEICSDFYCYYLLNKRQVLRNMSSGSTFKELSKYMLENFFTYYPPLPEQQNIAEILSTVDVALEKINETIARTQILKKSMMQELLTKGISHKEFKNSKIGIIPKEWHLLKLADIATFKNGINFSKDQKGNEGILTIDVLNMYGDNIFLTFNNLYRVNISIAKDSDYLLRKGDILIVRSSLKREGSGWASLFDGFSEKATFCGFIIRARLINPDILPEFLVYFLRSNKSRKIMVHSSGQVAITNISQAALAIMNIPIPPLPEQQRIVEILSSLDYRLHMLKNKKTKINKIKEQLMQDLLTGKKRVQT